MRGRALEMTAIIVIITIKTIQKQLSRQGKWKGRVGAGGGVGWFVGKDAERWVGASASR